MTFPTVSAPGTGIVAARSYTGTLNVLEAARRAGVDKVLVYRYFGGLPGLLAAYAEQGGFWWRPEDILAEPMPGGDDPQGLAKALWLALERHAAFLRSHPVALEAIACILARYQWTMTPEAVEGWGDHVTAFADDLRRAGHTVHTPDLFEGRTFRWTSEQSYVAVAGLTGLEREVVLTMSSGGRPGQLVDQRPVVDLDVTDSAPLEGRGVVAAWDAGLAPALRRARVRGPETMVLDVGVPGQRLDDGLWPVLDALVDGLEPSVRERTTLQVLGSCSAQGRRHLRRVTERRGLSLEYGEDTPDGRGSEEVGGQGGPHGSAHAPAPWHASPMSVRGSMSGLSE